jgi:hypothetical protein
MLDTLCGSACGSRDTPGFSNNRSSCYSPSAAGDKLAAAVLLRSVHHWVSSPGTDAHNGSLERCDTLVVRSVRILQLHTWPAHVALLLGEFFFDNIF